MIRLFSAPPLLCLALLTGCAGYGHHEMHAGSPGMMPAGHEMPHTMAAPAMFHMGVLSAHPGKTLYRFDKDTAGNGASACYGDCAVKWPPYLAPADAKAQGEFGLMTRTDGQKQWTYQGWPLYFWFADLAPGDKRGDGVGGVWHIFTR